MSKPVIFRLTEKRTPASWAISGGFAIKEGKGRKHINYYPGSDSIFVEDQTSDIPAQEVLFIYNDILSDPATEIVVNPENKVLIAYLMAHPFFNLHYYIHNEEQLSESKLANFNKIEKALSLIKETEDIKVQAMALAVFKMEAYGWSPVKSMAELKEKATTQPEVIISAMESNHYESKYLAALAFYSGIVSENITRSAVVWCDADQEVIIRLALGENGIQKLGEKLSVSNEESHFILQKIGARLEKKETSQKPRTKIQEPTSKTEAEIRAEIKAELQTNAKAETEIHAEIKTDMATAAPIAATETDTQKMDLAKLQTQYTTLFAEEPPVNKKNNMEWLKTKISSKEI